MTKVQLGSYSMEKVWVVIPLLIISLQVMGQGSLVAQFDRFNTPVNTPLLLDLLANDSSTRGLALQFSLGNPTDGVSRQPCGQVFNNGDGSASFSPNLNYQGRCEFSYTITDGIEEASALAFVEVGVGATAGMARAWVSASAKGRVQVQNSDAIDLNSYHLLWNPNCENTPCWDTATGTCDNDCNEAPFFDQVNQFLETNNGKPVIVSSDGAGALWRAILEELQLEIINGYPKGTRHLEHFDQPFNQVSMDGYIDHFNDWDQGPLNRLAQLGSHADPLAPGGRLSIAGDKILWNGQPVTLMGFSLYGMLSTSRHDLEHYLDMLMNNGVNFTREWCFEQWTAQAVGTGTGGFDTTGLPGYHTALSPFSGSRPQNLHPPVGAGELYRLDRWNQAFFQRLAQFVSMAWDRGIVVQISLFDRAGLRNNNASGHWKHSPYNELNNQQGPSLPITAGTQYPMQFTGRDDTEIGAINSAFVGKVVETLRPYGNVIFEVMNEPNDDFPLAAEVLPWHEWVASNIHGAYGSGEPEPLATTDPEPVLVPQDATASFTSSPSGGSGDHTVRWYFGPQDSGPWSFIEATEPGMSGTTKSTLMIHTAQAANPEGWYRALVRDAANPDDRVWSSPAQLTIDGSLIFVQGPGDVLIDQGETGVFLITRSGGSGEYTIRWYFSASGAGSWTILKDTDVGISGAKTTALAVDTNTADTTAGFYKALVRDKNNPSILSWSRVGQLSFNDSPLNVGGPLPSNAVIPAGGSQAFAVTPAGGSGVYQYQWEFQSQGLGAWQTITAPRFSGMESPTLVLTGALAADSGHFRCLINDNQGDQVTSESAILTVQTSQAGIVSVNLGQLDESQGLELTNSPPHGTTVGVSAGPSSDLRDARKNREDDPQEEHYRFFFKVDNQWPHHNEPTLTITLDYLDKIGGLIELHYNAVGNNAKVHPQKIAVGNSNTWRTHSWQLNDAAFSDGMAFGSDFRFHHSFGNHAQFWVDQAQVHTMQVEGPFPTDPNPPAGSNLTLWVNSPTGGMGGTTYAWFHNGDIIPNATASSYAITQVGSQHEGAYACRVQDAEGKVCQTQTTRVSVTSIGLSSIVDQTVVAYDPVEWMVTATGGVGTYTYQWQANTQGNWTDLVNDPPRILGVVSDTLIIDSALQEDAGQYRCIVENNAQVVTSNHGQLTVLPFNQVSIDLGGQAAGDGDQWDRLEHTTDPANGNTEIVFQSGRWCRRLVSSATANPPGDDEFMFFKVDNGWAWQGNRPEVTVTVQYLDHAQVGTLELVYDGANGITTHPDGVVLGGSQQWLTHTWPLSEALFGDGMAFGADLRIHRIGGGDGQFFLDQVMVEGPLAPVGAVAVQPIAPTLGLGQSVTFNTHAFDGRPPYQYLWLKDGQAIDGVANEPNLTLGNLSLADGGYYSCRVSDDFGDEALASESQLTVVDESVAVLDLGVNNQGNFLELVEPGGSGNHGQTGNTMGVSGWGNVPGPRECRRNLDPTGADDQKPDTKMFFRVDDSWAQGRASFQITVDYLDTGRVGEIRLTYYTAAEVPVTLTGQPISLLGDNEPNGNWRSFTWILNNAKFHVGGMASSTDFYLERFAGGDQARRLLVIDRVTVE